MGSHTGGAMLKPIFWPQEYPSKSARLRLVELIVRVAKCAHQLGSAHLQRFVLG